MADIDIHALAGAYVLDAVDDLERAAFTRHLAQCASCATEVDEMRETAARLADSTFSVPPPRLRTEVLATVARTRQLAPGAATRPERDTGAVVSRWRRFTAGAAAAGILAVGAGATTYAIQEQRVRHQTAVAEAAEAKQTRTQDILTAPDVRIRTVAMPGGGRLSVATSASRGAGVMVVAAGTAPAANQALQLWTLSGDKATNVAVLNPGEASDVRIIDGLPGGVAVSLEPAGGSPTPTNVLAAIKAI